MSVFRPWNFAAYGKEYTDLRSCRVEMAALADANGIKNEIGT
jgi:hypothetical protein